MARGPGTATAKVQGLSARQYAVVALLDIIKNGATLDDALTGVLGYVESPQDRGLVRAIVTMTLRRKGQIDDALKQFLTKPLPAKSGSAGVILQAAAAQLLFMRIPAHAAIDLAVRLARADRNARHFSGLINAVLRKIATAGDELLQNQDAARLNTPGWLMQMWCKAYGAETARRIAEAHLTEPPLDLTVRTRSETERWATALGGNVLPTGTIRLSERSGRIEDLPGYSEGAWWVQDAAAALPVHLLGDVSGKRVLDLCAAPGGKTAQLASAGAKVTAVDSSQSRLERLADNLKRLQLDAELICEDATRFSVSAQFDAVLADVPCSATGTIRRHPDLPLLKTKDQIVALHDVQARILERAIELVRPGGRVVYCTCSLAPQEGVEVVESVLARPPPISRDPVTSNDVFGQGHLISEHGDLRTLPCQKLGDHVGLDGFYASRLVNR